MSNFLIAYSQLLSLRENIPEANIEEYWVEQFHAYLDEMGSVFGDDVTNKFKVDKSQISSRIVNHNGKTGVSKYSSKRYCSRAVLIMKVDAFIKYIQLSAPPEEKKAIGFSIN